LNQLSSACLRKFGRHMSKQAQQNPAMIIKKFRSNLELLGTEGKHQSRLISLTHKAQLKRFTQDITKILKSQQYTKMEINELPALYEDCHGKKFEICDYGVCHIEHLLSSISHTTLEIYGHGTTTTIVLPKNLQSKDQIDRTTKFGDKVIELLRDCETYSLPLASFVTVYQRHFGKELNITEYGCVKLQDLIESISEIAVIEEKHESLLSLTVTQRIKILSEQIRILFKTHQNISMFDLSKLFFNQFHRRFDPVLYSHNSIRALIDQISDVALTEQCPRTKQIFVREVTHSDCDTLAIFKRKLFTILFESMSPEFEEKEAIFVSYDHLLETYNSETGKKFAIKDYVASLVWDDFSLLVRYSIKIFIQYDQHDGICLNRLFYEATKAWDILVGLHNQTHRQIIKEIPISLVEREFEREMIGQNKLSLKYILSHLTPIVALNNFTVKSSIPL
jgi:hypothetical protein